ncbi:20502_t:CDS:1 [Gigaspora margarita]|uniref:20502_t:CDS:1 n=1 Tax=Gigaspora margarita TaxID=4874 RepID=A0ABN7UQG8_GIGMA|nr:20502_t:CDS:1 [Gigaspora margarita]
MLLSSICLDKVLVDDSLNINKGTKKKIDQVLDLNEDTKKKINQVLDLNEGTKKKIDQILDLNEGTKKKIDWIENNKIEHLNVAGPREQTSPGIFENALLFMGYLLKKLEELQTN